MYKDKETLITVEPLGKEGTPMFIPVGSKVEFVKVLGGSLDTSKLIVSYNGKKLVVKETEVKVQSLWRRLQAIRSFNKMMVKGYPRLRMYHGFFFQRWFWRSYYYVADKLAGKKVDEIGGNK